MLVDMHLDAPACHGRAPKIFVFPNPCAAGFRVASFQLCCLFLDDAWVIFGGGGGLEAALCSPSLNAVNVAEGMGVDVACFV